MHVIWVANLLRHSLHAFCVLWGVIELIMGDPEASGGVWSGLTW